MRRPATILSMTILAAAGMAASLGGAWAGDPPKPAPGAKPDDAPKAKPADEPKPKSGNGGKDEAAYKGPEIHWVHSLAEAAEEGVQRNLALYVHSHGST